MRLRFFVFLPLGRLVLTAPAADPPNLIVFYTDDHGWADLGVHGIRKDIRTPHLDSLARSGVVARHGYSTAPQCVPSRAGLLTGRFQREVWCGVQRLTTGWLQPPAPIASAYRLAFQREPIAAQQLITQHCTDSFCRALLNANELLYLE